MSAPAAEPVNVPLAEVERELSRQLQVVHGPGDHPVLRVRMSNLVIFCPSREAAADVTAQVPDVAAVHPARILLLVGEEGADSPDVTATVQVCCHPLGAQRASSEWVTLHAAGGAVNRLPFAVRSLLVADLPTNLWWACPQPPPLAGPLLYELAEQAQQLIYDSRGWREPALGVAATAGWLPQFTGQHAGGRWRVAADLNWRRLKYWRRVVAQALDPASAPGAAESISEVSVEHGPHAVIQAWELVSWLSSRLGWQVVTGRVQPGQEIAWRFAGAEGDLRVRVRRLESGPPEVRSVRFACRLGGQAVTIEVAPVGENRLVISMEGVEASLRTVTVPPQTAAELVGRQLSDREPDPVFYESMSAAESLARSVL